MSSDHALSREIDSQPFGRKDEAAESSSYLKDHTMLAGGGKLVRILIMRLSRQHRILRGDFRMTYCLGIMTREGLIMASDSRTNAGYDQVNVCRKVHTFTRSGDRAFALLTSGSVSLTQSVLALLNDDFAAGRGLASVTSMYAAARVVGDCVRRVSEMDRAALERDQFSFNIHLILGGQVKGEAPGLYLIYPQGNPLSANQDSPYLQIGEVKYGRPILDRGIVYNSTPLEVAAMYALLSIDATVRSNVTVGPPIDLLVYPNDKFDFNQHRRFLADDPELALVHSQWEQALRKAVEDLPRMQVADMR